MGGRIRTQRDGHIGWLIFDHPERRNAISSEMWNQLPPAVQELDDDPEIRVIVLRGEGDIAFVSGADISEFESNRSGDSAGTYNRTNADAFLALQNTTKPVLAMIHGFCVGGGVAISLTADMRYAADDAVFAVPAARLGLGYAAGGVDTLARLVGPSNAKEIFFTARRYRADEALRMGLVNDVIPKADLEAHVRGMAERIADNAPLTVRSVKRISQELALEPAKRDYAALDASITACFDSEDYKEGVRAFLEKRRPEFKGR